MTHTAKLYGSLLFIRECERFSGSDRFLISPFTQNVSISCPRQYFCSKNQISLKRKAMPAIRIRMIYFSKAAI